MISSLCLSWINFKSSHTGVNTDLKHSGAKSEVTLTRRRFGAVYSFHLDYNTPAAFDSLCHRWPVTKYVSLREQEEDGCAVIVMLKAFLAAL